MKLMTRIQGILFVSGDQGVSIKELSEALSVVEKDIREVLNDLTLSLRDDADSPVELIMTNNRYRLVTKPTIHDDVETFAQNSVHQPLSRAAIETLAIIAYRQPITRVGVDEIRGVSSANMIQRLISRHLVRELGRVEAPGRPFLYGVTNYFLDYFGLNSLKELPPIESIALNVELSSEKTFKDKQWIINVEEEENNEEIYD
ncbi:SMC-Scp complex subunit ScpB [Aerococcaceae bacterium DSM 111022]|nr:SMC-Scp complex subunit ScpB [Aerococcaceae bacterium DSM 111022]